MDGLEDYLDHMTIVEELNEDFLEEKEDEMTSGLSYNFAHADEDYAPGGAFITDDEDNEVQWRKMKGRRGVKVDYKVLQTGVRGDKKAELQKYQKQAAGKRAITTHPNLFMLAPHRSKPSLRVVVVSDTHYLAKHVRLPHASGDLLLHCGDFSFYGHGIGEFKAWLLEQAPKYRYGIIVITGNHEMLSTTGKRDPRDPEDVLRQWHKVLTVHPKVRFVTNRLQVIPVETDAGTLVIAAVPWAGSGLSDAYSRAAKTPCHILMSHEGPSIQGLASEGHSHRKLTEYAEQGRVNARVHVFGHDHAGAGRHSLKHGTLFINCASKRYTKHYTSLDFPLPLPSPGKPEDERFVNDNHQHHAHSAPSGGKGRHHAPDNRRNGHGHGHGRGTPLPSPGKSKDERFVNDKLDHQHHAHSAPSGGKGRHHAPDNRRNGHGHGHGRGTPLPSPGKSKDERFVNDKLDHQHHAHSAPSGGKMVVEMGTIRVRQTTRMVGMGTGMAMAEESEDDWQQRPLG
eukprot:CAMPEP_0174335162 /NCGR_PEP_ID=MMETSP0810-20121108/20559_1 /TAXON_ID=73025 ORGANISM="Eutreptiella gymnastica-like, Strain CCMP1594" /NCGR_SAMPLE_ID=MMETSP0810 /ASSEMBLY_ACC=CAM_ASM_000659 /LENGTH=509 /DNA_ID=CAMNT_0015453369 /DNA_START=37 /DNA_END=1566 /DNA_ORIENTATION=+